MPELKSQEEEKAPPNSILNAFQDYKRNNDGLGEFIRVLIRINNEPTLKNVFDEALQNKDFKEWAESNSKPKEITLEGIIGMLRKEQETTVLGKDTIDEEPKWLTQQNREETKKIAESKKPTKNPIIDKFNNFFKGALNKDASSKQDELIGAINELCLKKRNPSLFQEALKDKTFKNWVMANKQDHPTLEQALNDSIQAQNNQLTDCIRTKHLNTRYIAPDWQNIEKKSRYTGALSLKHQIKHDFLERIKALKGKEFIDKDALNKALIEGYEKFKFTDPNFTPEKYKKELLSGTIFGSHYMKDLISIIDPKWKDAPLPDLTDASENKHHRTSRINN